METTSNEVMPDSVSEKRGKAKPDDFGAMSLETSIEQQEAPDEAAARRYLPDLSAAVGAGF